MADQSNKQESSNQVDRAEEESLSSATEEGHAGTEQEAVADSGDGIEEPEKDKEEKEGSPDPLARLEQELAQARKEAEENYQRFLRAQADLENVRRRARIEKEQTLKYALAPLMEALLPVLDNFDRALLAADKDSPLTQGVEMVYRQLRDTLQSQGLQEVKALGKPFDPHYHQAVMREEAEGTEPGMVLEVIQKGYQLHDRVLRPAMVKVSG